MKRSQLNSKRNERRKKILTDRFAGFQWEPNAVYSSHSIMSSYIVPVP